MRIKKIAERRMIWGDPRLKRNTDHWGCCRPDLHAKNARERASAACPDGAAAPKRPRNARAPRRWFFEDTPRWREVNELPTSEFIIVVRQDQIFQSGGPGTHPRGSRKARAAAGQFADSPSRDAINGLLNS